MMIASLNQQAGRIYPQFGDAFGFDGPLPSIGVGPLFSATSLDLTTLLVPHLAYLRSVYPSTHDDSTNFSQDIPTVRGAESALNDLGTQYFVYLHGHQ